MCDQAPNTDECRMIHHRLGACLFLVFAAASYVHRIKMQSDTLGTQICLHTWGQLVVALLLQPLGPSTSGLDTQPWPCGMLRVTR